MSMQSTNPSGQPSIKVASSRVNSPPVTLNSISSQKKVTINFGNDSAPSSIPLNLSLPSLGAPPNMRPVGFSQVSPGSVHPHLNTMLSTISAEISNSVENYIDTVLSTQIKSSLTLAATLASSNSSNSSGPAVDPVLLQQSMQCARAMILNCKMTLSPWLKAQLEEQSTFLIANNQGSKHKFYNYATAFDSAPPSGHRNGRKRSVDVRPQDMASSRRSSHTMHASSNALVHAAHPSSEALIQRPHSPQGNTVDHHTRACEKLIKTADTENLHFHLYTLQSDAQGIYEGDVTERPDTFDDTLFKQLLNKEITVQDVMGMVLGSYGPAGTTLLHAACAHKRADAIPILVSFGADPNAQNNRHVTPAQICVEQSDSATAEALRDAGGCLTSEEAKEYEGKGSKSADRRLINILIGGSNALPSTETASSSDFHTQSASQLHMTRRNSAVAGAGAVGMTIHTDPKMAEYAKVVLAQVPKTVPANAGEKQISRWLERLVKYGEKEDIGRFLDSMTTTDRVYYTGAFGYSKSTLLFTAAWNRRVDMIEYLIDTYKIDPTVRNVRKHTALTMCLEQGESEGVQMLLQYGVSVNEKEVKEVEQRTGKTVDSVSAELVHEHCKLKKICSVFESNREVREKDKEKDKPKRREAWRADIHKELERIVKFGDEAKIRELIDGLSPGLREAQLGPVGQTKSSLLFTAAWNKRSDMCRILCEYKADVNHRNVRKNAAICMAIEQNDVDCVSSLLECGADSSSGECREIEKRTGKQIDDKIYEAIFDFCNK